MLPRIICALISFLSSLTCIPLTDPTVPTGMKMGVWMAPWSVWMTPARARVPPWSVCWRLKVILLFFFYGEFHGVVYLVLKQGNLEYVAYVLHVLEGYSL